MSEQRPSWYDDPDDPRSWFMEAVADGLEKVINRPDWEETIARFTAGDVTFIVRRDGVQVRDRRLGVPADN